MADFDDLLRAWQDGEATAEELDVLEAALRSDGSLRRRLVESVLIESALYARCARQAPAAPVRRRRVFELAAAVLLVAVTGMALGKLWRAERPAAVERFTVRVTPAAGKKDWSRLADRARLSLAEAVERALANGGRATQAALEDDDGTPLFAVRVLRDGRAREIEVDAENGKVLDDEPEGEAVEEASGPELLEAVAEALARQPGRAVKAERERGAVEVEVWSLGKLYEVTVELKMEGRR